MEVCLLCLETNKNSGDIIKVNSTQWEVENINQLIEKHLWQMDTIQSSTCVCISCWQELYDFHKFYVRIEKAHTNLELLMKTEDDNELLKTPLEDDCKELFDKDALVENHFEPEILMEQSIPHEFLLENENVCIKSEQDDELSPDYDSVEQKRKRGRAPKLTDTKIDEITEDPLNKSDQVKTTTKTTAIKIKKSKETGKKSCSSVKLVEEKQKDVKDENDGDLDDLNGQDSTDSDTDFDNHSGPQPLETVKKRRRNPDEKTSQEHDKFISENFQIMCSFCQVSLDNFIVLRKHFREEHKKRGFVICCKKKIFSRPLLVDHIQIHLDPNYFQCKQCDKVYSERSTLESHVKTHELGENHRKHVCETCGKSFVGNSQLLNHKRKHEPNYEKFSCTECGKFFTTSYSLNYHIEAIHQNKYVNICDICGKTMRCRNQFKLHVAKHDSKLSTSINCEICGLTLTDRRGLRRHMNSQHPVGGKKEYNCHLCSKVSPNQEALRTHIRFTHGTNYNHKCTMCDKAFKRPYALREHMATHTGTALYTCPWCPKTFISNGNMHNHRKKAHPKEWEEAHRKKFSNNLVSTENSSISENLNMA